MCNIQVVFWLLVSPIKLMSMFLDSGRELEYREERKPHMEKIPKEYMFSVSHH